MPKQFAQDDLDIIVNVVARFPDGVSLSMIMENLNISISYRTIQHRLAFLVKKGLLQADGRTSR